MAKNFSDKYLASLKPQEKMYSVREAKGFAIRVLPTGTKTFMFIYEVSGKRKYLNLGTYPLTSLTDARKRYNDAVQALHDGEPLVKEPEPEPAHLMLVSEVTAEYLKESKQDDVDAWHKIKASICNNKIKQWHDRPMINVTKTEAIGLVDVDRERGDGAMRTTYRVLHALFQYAEDREYIPKNPFRRMKSIKPALKNRERARFLTEREIKVAWEGIGSAKCTEATQRALKLILVTAQRPGEVAGMHRKEIEGDWWIIPAERAMKGNGDHRVFLTETAKELIGNAEGYIFPSPMKDAKTGHLNRISMSQVVKLAESFGLPRWTPHDLRRTARTHMSRLRVPREHAEAVLNHAKQGMVKVYDQYRFDNEKREALQVWESELGRLLAQASTSE